MTRAGVVPKSLRLAATAIALALATTYAAADGIPGVVMTDSQYLTDWSGIYIGGKLGGTWSDFNWQTDANVFNFGGGGGFEHSHRFLSQRRHGRHHRRRQSATRAMDLRRRAVVLGHGPFTVGHQPVLSRHGYLLDRAQLARHRRGAHRLFLGPRDGVRQGRLGRLQCNAEGEQPNHEATRSTSEFVDGWTIGGGIEYAVWNSVIIGVEYDYVSLSLTSGGSCDLCDAGLLIDSTPSAVTGDATMSAVMLRASYLFMPED